MAASTWCRGRWTGRQAAGSRGGERESNRAMLTDQERQEIEARIEPHGPRQSACVDALRIVQQHRGWVSDEALEDVSRFLGMTMEELESVATFYSMIYRRPVGRHVIRICDNVACWIMGYDLILDHLTVRLGLRMGETSEDDRFTLLPAACLGACDGAPALMIDDDLHTELDPHKLDDILERYP